MPKITGSAALLATLFLIASCSTSSATGSSSPASGHTGTTPASPGESHVSSVPATFTSASYGYTVTVPAGWSSRQAFSKWDGQSELDGGSAEIDVFGQPTVSRGVFVAAARWKQDLAAYATFLIAWNKNYHGDYCPPTPNTRSRVTVGGQPGVLLAYNCGILVNNVVTVHNGVGYVFAFIDRGVAAATDPTDHKTFLKLLKSVRFPG